MSDRLRHATSLMGKPVLQLLKLADLPAVRSYTMTEDAFMRLVAEDLVRELTPNLTIKKFANNTDVIGAFAEASVRRFVDKMVAPARVSTGAVISETLCEAPDNVPQIDTIIWIPMPLPAIFEVGDFGLVPSMSVLGVIEIKRSSYSGVGAKIKSVTDREKEFVSQTSDDGGYNALPGAYGVLCVHEKDWGETALKELVAANKAAILMVPDGKGGIEVDPIAVYRLIEFLMIIRTKMTMIDGKCKFSFKK